MRFNEWLNKAHPEPELTTNPDLGMLSQTDEAVVLNQLDQLAGRVYGILYNVPEDRRGPLVAEFIKALKSRLVA